MRMNVYNAGSSVGPAFSAVSRLSPSPGAPPMNSAMTARMSPTAAATRTPVARKGAALGSVTMANRRKPRNCRTWAVSRTTGSTARMP
jgi:hypothetical protein